MIAVVFENQNLRMLEKIQDFHVSELGREQEELVRLNGLSTWKNVELNSAQKLDPGVLLE